LPSLPVESVIKELQSSLQTAAQVILQAPPGAGKSTFLPLLMIKEKWFSGKIIMLEPRRLAAKNIAFYLSSLLAEPVGQTIGYRMRGENRTSKNTCLEIVTEGILTRLLQSDPELTGFDLIIFDEFHERNLQGDLGLALALDCQSALREDLKLLIMSATLDNDQLQKKLPEATFISSKGRSYPIEFFYQPFKNKQNLVSDLVKLTVRAYQEQNGNILLFVAGVKEIKQCCNLLNEHFSKSAEQVLIAPLYGALDLKEQQKAISFCDQDNRKIVIATNIAETSLTIEGITVVVDSGFERVMNYQSRSGVCKLQTQRISIASATQRSGRAGRLKAGFCYRLWSADTPLNKQSLPEIQRSDLSSLLLEILNWGVSSADELLFITPPSDPHLQAAFSLLLLFNAIDKRGRITKHGQAISQLGITPRLGHLLLRAIEIEKEFVITGLTNLSCYIVALLESNERGSDDIEQYLAKPSYLVNSQYQQLLKKLHLKKTAYPLPLSYCGLLVAIAFPDRIAQNRDVSGSYLLSNGIGASLFRSSNLINEKLLVVADLAFSEFGVNSLIYKAATVSIEQLDQFLPHYFTEQELIRWSISDKKLVAEKRVCLGKLVISKKPLNNVSNSQKTEALLEGIKQAGLSVLTWSDENRQLLLRLNYGYAQFKRVDYKIAFPDFSKQVLIDSIDIWLAPYLQGITRPEQLKKVDLKGALLSRLDWSALQQFNKLFPISVKVPTGSSIKIEYREKESPVLSVRMQELFGQQETPCIFNGNVKLQLALLSPARRPLQLTQDLATFWAGAYNDVKKEMRGRYPKHYWPDDPLQAVATKRTKKHLKQ